MFSSGTVLLKDCYIHRFYTKLSSLLSVARLQNKAENQMLLTNIMSVKKPRDKNRNQIDGIKLIKKPDSPILLNEYSIRSTKS